MDGIRSMTRNVLETAVADGRLQNTLSARPKPSATMERILPHAAHQFSSTVVQAPAGEVFNLIRTMRFKWMHTVSSVDVDEDGLINVAYADNTVQTLNQLEYSTLDMKVAWEVVGSDPPVHCSSQVHTIECTRITDMGWCYISWNTDFSMDADLQVIEDCKWKKIDAFEQLKNFVTPAKAAVEQATGAAEAPVAAAAEAGAPAAEAPSEA